MDKNHPEQPSFLSSKGSYILILELKAAKTINVGRLGTILFPKGLYVYLGSALGGFKSRINRHLNPTKQPRWHIDYLSKEARVLEIIFYQTETRLECLLSQALDDELPSITGFGSSDCQCRSHLYLARERPRLELLIARASAQLIPPEKQKADKILKEVR